VSGTYLTGLADWLRAAGCVVVEYAGWQSRARSSGGYATGRPWGVMWHHTASSTSPQNDADYMCNGSSDRPIANLLIARDGGIWILAAGCTNTNGKGGPWAWSRGTVPADSMNTYAVGIEIANAGTGSEPYPQAQIDAAFAASITICQRLGLADSDICQHWNWAPSRKIDPATAAAVQGPWRPSSCTSSGTWDLADLIAEHRARWHHPTPPTPEAPDMTDEQAAQLTAVYNWLNHSASGWTPTAKMVNELRTWTGSTVAGIDAGEILTRLRAIEDRMDQS
jgi:N-acetylmuramoyl-L-alanine amidase